MPAGNNVSYVMAGKVVNIKICGTHQHHLGLIAKSSEVRHYAYTQRSVPFRQSGLLSLRASHSRSKRYGTERERKPNCLSLCLNLSALAAHRVKTEQNTA